MTMTDIITTTNARTLDVVTSVQQQILDGAKAFLSFASDGDTELPSAKNLLDETYSFQSRLLKANHDFSVAMSDAFSGWTASAASDN